MDRARTCLLICLFSDKMHHEFKLMTEYQLRFKTTGFYVTLSKLHLYLFSPTLETPLLSDSNIIPHSFYPIIYSRQCWSNNFNVTTNNMIPENCLSIFKFVLSFGYIPLGAYSHITVLKSLGIVSLQLNVHRFICFILLFRYF